MWSLSFVTTFSNININNATFVFEEEGNPGYVVKVWGEKGKPSKFIANVDRNKNRKMKKTIESGLPAIMISLCYSSCYSFKGSDYSDDSDYNEGNEDNEIKKIKKKKNSKISKRKDDTNGRMDEDVRMTMLKKVFKTRKFFNSLILFPFAMENSINSRTFLN